jgi:pyrimidine operon attenuation protein/uracil phosphoribosyltransferase
MDAAKRVLLEKQELARTLTRMAHEVLEKNGGPSALVLVGIRSRGAQLARRLGQRIEEFAKVPVPVGVVDVTRFRDDRDYRELAASPTQPSPVTIPVSIEDKTVVLVDDVIFRGRTIRAAMDAIHEFGEPARVLLAIVIDRGARELPFRADIVGKNVAARETERINVLLEETDGIDQVVVSPWEGRSRT